MRKFLRFSGLAFLFSLLAAALVFISAGVILQAGVAVLDGEIEIPGLHHPVSVSRDAEGLAHIDAQDLLDLDRAEGFIHAQERFFQMDLARRRASGRMAEIFGSRALNWDTRIRAYRLGKVARRAVEQLQPEERARIEAYCQGVNAGLAALPGRPFEYVVLGVEPEAWKAEDSALVVLSMYLQLNGWEGHRKMAFSALAEGLPPEFFGFLVTRGTRMDAPMMGAAFSTPAIPGPECFRLDHGKMPPKETPAGRETPEGVGSNAWAVGASRSSDGRAILACDMHLGLLLPNTWFRVILDWKDEQAASEMAVGVSLPGVPGVVVGSNTHVAWGFTNSYGDWIDLIAFDPVGVASYHSPQGLQEFDNFEEKIRIRGRDPVTRQYQSTIWGPVVGEDGHGRPVALRWIAERPGGVNFNLIRMASVRTLEEALETAHSCGIPPQNFVVADESGRIGWTIAGRIPKRFGCGSTWPPRINTGECRWEGWLPSEDYPQIKDPPSDLIWTANARVVDGAWLELLGDGGYNLGARALQIRDDLLSRAKIDEEGMLEIQLDDRALFLGWWRNLLLKTLRHAPKTPKRQELEDFVEHWSGRASVDDPGYRFVRAFRIYTRSLVLDPLVKEACGATELPCGWDFLGQREGPLRRILEERPGWLLNPAFESWESLLGSAADRVIQEFSQNGSHLRDHPWGERNRLGMFHPLAPLAPAPLRKYLAMPSDPLPGDTEMPRVQGPSFGASERLVVSPGHESEGIFEMPGGQSGNPRSPFFRAGHENWVSGKASPLMGGENQHQLRLLPKGDGRLTP